MRRSNRNNNTQSTYYNKKAHLEQDDPEISSIVVTFKKSLKEQILKLTQQGLSPRKASNIVMKRLISKDIDLHNYENIKYIQHIQSTLGSSIEEALHTFLIYNELNNLIELGFNSTEAVNELINRINYSNVVIDNITEDLSEIKKPSKKRALGDISNNTIENSPKKMKSIQNDKDIIYDEPKETILQTFNPFQPKFTSKTSRIDYFQKNKLKFSSDKDSSTSDEEEYSSNETVSQEDNLIYMYDDLMHNSALFNSMLFSNIRRPPFRRRSRHPFTDVQSFRDPIHFPRLEIENALNRPIPVQHFLLNRIRNDVDELENVSHLSSDSEVTHRDGYSF